MIRKGIFLGALVLIIGLTNLFAQNTTGQLSGTVTDQNGAIVSGASVRITNNETNFTRTATTNEEGIYSFQLLPVGRYAVEITAQNFQVYRAEAVVNVTQTTVVDAQLGVGGDTVTVDVEAPVLQLETSQQGRVVTGESTASTPTRSGRTRPRISPFRQAIHYRNSSFKPRFTTPRTGATRAATSRRSRAAARTNFAGTFIIFCATAA
jgi:hypothetical protein